MPFLNETHCIAQKNAVDFGIKTIFNAIFVDGLKIFLPFNFIKKERIFRCFVINP